MYKWPGQLQGEIEFKSLLFIPPMAPLNSEMWHSKKGDVRLYVKRVFISDQFNGELVCFLLSDYCFMILFQMGSFCDFFNIPSWLSLKLHRMKLEDGVLSCEVVAPLVRRLVSHTECYPEDSGGWCYSFIELYVDRLSVYRLGSVDNPLRNWSLAAVCDREIKNVKLEFLWLTVPACAAVSKVFELHEGDCGF